jgi:hypothetical protein
MEMPFERIRGRIDAEGVVVDGPLLTWDEFVELLQPYEGWEFGLRIPLEPDWESRRRAGTPPRCDGRR